MSYNEEQQSLNQKIREELSLLQDRYFALRHKLYFVRPKKAYVAKYRLFKILSQTAVGANPNIKDYNQAILQLTTSSAAFVAENTKGSQYTQQDHLLSELQGITGKPVRELLSNVLTREIAAARTRLNRAPDETPSWWDQFVIDSSLDYTTDYLETLTRVLGTLTTTKNLTDQSLNDMSFLFGQVAPHSEHISPLLGLALSIDYEKIKEDDELKEDPDILRWYLSSPVKSSWMSILSMVGQLAANYDMPMHYLTDNDAFISDNSLESIKAQKSKHELLHSIQSVRRGFEKAIEKEEALFKPLTFKELATAKDIGLVLLPDELIEALDTVGAELPELTYKERKDVITQLSKDKFFKKLKSPLANFIANDFTNKEARENTPRVFYPAPPTPPTPYKPKVTSLDGYLVNSKLANPLKLASLDIESVGDTAYLAQVSSNSFVVGNTRVSNSTARNYYIKLNDFSKYDEDAAQFLLDTQDPEGGIVTTKIRSLLSEEILTEDIERRLKSWSFSAAHKVTSAKDYFKPKGNSGTTIDSVRGDLLHKAITIRLTKEEILAAVTPYIPSAKVRAEYVAALTKLAEDLPRRVSEVLLEAGLSSTKGQFEKDFSIKVRSTTFTGRIDLYLPEYQTIIDFKSTRSIKPYVADGSQVKLYAAALNRGHLYPKVNKVGYFKLPSINIINDDTVLVDDTVSLTFTSMDGADEELESTAKTVESWNAIGELTVDARKKGIVASYIPVDKPSTTEANKKLLKDSVTRVKEFFQKMEEQGENVISESDQHSAIKYVLDVGGTPIYAGHNINFDILRLALAERDLPWDDRRVLVTAGTTQRALSFFDKHNYGNKTKAKAYGYETGVSTSMASNEVYIEYMKHGGSFEDKVKGPIGIIRKENNRAAKVIDTISISQSALFKAFTLAYFVEEGYRSDAHYSIETLQKLRANILSDENIRALGGTTDKQKDYLLYFLSNEGKLNRKDTLLNAIKWGLFSTSYNKGIDYGYSQKDMYRILYGTDPPKGLHNSSVDVGVNRDLLLYFLEEKYISNHSPVSSFLGSLIHAAILDYAHSGVRPTKYTFERALLQKSSAAVKLILDAMDDKKQGLFLKETLADYRGTVSIDPKTSGVDDSIISNVVNLLRWEKWYQNEVDITVERSPKESHRIVRKAVNAIKDSLNGILNIKRSTPVTNNDNFKKLEEYSNKLAVFVKEHKFDTAKEFMANYVDTSETYKQHSEEAIKEALFYGARNGFMDTIIGEDLKGIINRSFTGKEALPANVVDHMVKQLTDELLNIVTISSAEDKKDAVTNLYTRRLFNESNSEDAIKTLSRGAIKKEIINDVLGDIAMGSYTPRQIIAKIDAAQRAKFSSLNDDIKKADNAALKKQERTNRKIEAEKTADINKANADKREVFTKGLRNILNLYTNGEVDFAPEDISVFTNPNVSSTSDHYKSAVAGMISTLEHSKVAKDTVTFAEATMSNTAFFSHDKWGDTEKGLLNHTNYTAGKMFPNDTVLLGVLGNTRTVDDAVDVLSIITKRSQREQAAALNNERDKRKYLDDINSALSSYIDSGDYTDDDRTDRHDTILDYFGATRDNLGSRSVDTLRGLRDALVKNNALSDYIISKPGMRSVWSDELVNDVLAGRKWMSIEKFNEKNDKWTKKNKKKAEKEAIQKSLRKEKVQTYTDYIAKYGSEKTHQDAIEAGNAFYAKNWHLSPEAYNIGLDTVMTPYYQEAHLNRFVGMYPQYKKHRDEMAKGLAETNLSSWEDAATFLSNFCRDLAKAGEGLQNFANTLTKVSAFQLEKVIQTRYTALSGIADAASNGIFPSSLVSSVARLQQSSLQEMHSKTQWIYSLQEGIDAAQPLLSAATAGALANPVTMPIGVGMAAIQGLYGIGTQIYGIAKTKDIKENSLNIQSALNKINGAFTLGASILMNGFKLVKGVFGTGAAVINKSLSLLRTGATTAIGAGIGAGVAGAYMLNRSINGQLGLALSVSPMLGESDKTGFFRNTAEAAALGFNYSSLSSISASREMLFATGSLDMGKLIALSLLGEQNIMLDPNTDMNEWWKRKINDVRGKEFTPRQIALYNSVIPGAGDTLYQYSVLGPDDRDWFSPEHSRRKPLEEAEATRYRFYASAYDYAKKGFPELGQRLSHTFLKHGGLQDLNLVLGEATTLSTILESMLASAMEGNISGVVSGGKDLWSGALNSIDKIKNGSVLLTNMSKLTNKSVRDDLWQQVKKTAPATWDTVKSYGTRFKTGVMNWWNEEDNFLRNNLEPDNLKKLWNKYAIGAKVRDVADTGVSWFSSAVDKGMPYFKAGASRFIEATHSFLKDNKDTIVGTANQIADGILDVLSSKKAELTEIANILAEATIGAFTRNKDRWAELGTEIGNSFYEIADKWLDGVNDLLSRVRWNNKDGFYIKHKDTQLDNFYNPAGKVAKSDIPSLIAQEVFTQSPELHNYDVHIIIKDTKGNTILDDFIDNPHTSQKRTVYVNADSGQYNIINNGGGLGR